jgi:hypothetical protein
VAVPQGSWRSYVCVDGGDAGAGEILVINGGDDRVTLEWAPEVVSAAADADWTIDPNGYLAPLGVMLTATEDD